MSIVYKYTSDPLNKAYIQRFEIEEIEKWREWVDKIPYIRFPKDWDIKIIPPFAGAMIRFRIRTPKYDGVSVYLDVFDRLGYCGRPYWEVYPYHDDVGRCDMENIDELLQMIEDAGHKL